MADYCINSHPAGHRVRPHDIALGIFHRMQAFTAMPGQWRQRVADLRHLRSLDDHVLTDMGLTRTEVEREAHLPFWRPLLMVPGSRQDRSPASDPQ